MTISPFFSSRSSGIKYFSKPVQPVINAIAKDDPEELAQLIIDDEDIINNTFRIDIKNLPLNKIEYLACYFNAIKCLDVLENFGVNFNTVECLVCAAAGGSLEIFRRINLDEDYHEVKYNDFTPAIIAAKFGSINILQYIFSKIDLEIKRKVSDHPIVFAARFDQIECLKFLLETTTPEDDSRIIFVAKSICRAASQTKVDKALILLYEKYHNPDIRNIVKNFVVPCDSPYLYKKFFAVDKITNKAAIELTKSGSLRILKYLMANGAELCVLPSLINFYQSEEFVDLYTSIDPVFYFDKALASQRTNAEKLRIVLKLIDKVPKVTQEQFYKIIGLVDPTSPKAPTIYKVFYDKVDKDQKFINELFIRFLKKGYVNEFMDLELREKFTGEISDAWKSYTLSDASIIYLWKHHLIGKDQVNTKFLKKFVFSGGNFKDDSGRNYVKEITDSVGPLNLLEQFASDKIYPVSLVQFIITAYPQLKRSAEFNKFIEKHWTSFHMSILDWFNIQLVYIDGRCKFIFKGAK